MSSVHNDELRKKSLRIRGDAQCCRKLLRGDRTEKTLCVMVIHVVERYQPPKLLTTRRVGSAAGKSTSQERQQRRRGGTGKRSRQQRINNTSTTTPRVPRCLWILTFLILVMTCFLFYQQTHLLLHINFDLNFKATLFDDFTTSYNSSSSSKRINTNYNDTVYDSALGYFGEKKKKQERATIPATSNTNFTCSISLERPLISLPQVPNFIIAGAQKSGTTAIQKFLAEHPNIQVSTSKEPHFFDWYYPSSKQKDEYLLKKNMSVMETTESQLLCSLQETYFQDHFAANYTSGRSSPLLYCEKTPSYLFLTDVPERIFKTLPWGVKIIVILRNPVDRAYSHFKMSIRTKGKSFEELIDEEVACLNEVGLMNNAPLLSEYLKRAQNDEVPSIARVDVNGRNDYARFTIQYDKMNDMETKHWKHYRKMFTNNYLQRGMYTVQLLHWKKYFPINKNMLVIRYENFEEQPSVVFGQILDFLQLPRFIPAGGFETRHNTKTTIEQRTNKPISNTTRTYLNELFRPYNDLLADELGEEWRNAWK